MDNNKELLIRARDGDTEARDQLLNNNLGLVRSVIKRFLNRGIEYEDLFQIGSMGLLKAIDRFDVTKEFQFSTYAVPMIIGEVKRFFRDDGGIKINRSLKEMGSKVMRVKEEFLNTHEREPTISEIAEITGFQQDDIVMALDAFRPFVSLDDVVYQNTKEPIFLKDTLKDPKSSDGRWIDYIALKELIGSLQPKEKQIIFLRYFKDMTQTETAKIVGISQVQVSRIEKRILQELKRNFQETQEKIKEG